MPEVTKTLWELLWDYDPNGLLVMDLDMTITTVNPALCKMLKKTSKQLLGRKVDEFLPGTGHFKEAWTRNRVLRAMEKEYPEYGLYVREVIFPIRDQSVIACIMVDLTHEYQQKNEMLQLKRETLQQATAVVNRQMQVAQEIAGLLGETTAETQVSLLKLIDMVNKEEAS